MNGGDESGKDKRRKRPKGSGGGSPRDRTRAAVGAYLDRSDQDRPLAAAMSQAFQSLTHSGGAAVMDALSQGDTKALWILTREQRLALLTMAAVGGVLPKVQLIPVEGLGNEVAEQVQYDHVDAKIRIKCLELIGKMEGDYIEKHEHMLAGPQDEWVRQYGTIIEVVGDKDKGGQKK